MKKLVFAIILIATFIAGVALANVVSFLWQSQGTFIPSYDLALSPNPIEWGNVTEGVPVQRNGTVTNNGANVTALNMTYGNATAEVLNYTLTWDAEGESLPNGYYIIANFTLTIYEFNATAPTEFTVDIWIQDK